MSPAKRAVSGILAISALVALLVFDFGLLPRAPARPKVIGCYERVKLIGPAGEIIVEAKLDTGADSSSIDEGLARSLGYTPSLTEKKRIVTGQGVVERPTVRLTFILDDRKISTLVSVADRSALSAQMLIGKNDMEGYAIDATREYLTEPVGPAVSRFMASFSAIVSDRLGRALVLIPIFGAVVVLLRVIIGVRTYGLFAPTVIALTLLDLELLPGILIYISLAGIGIVLRVLVLPRFHLAHIAQLSLILFVAALLLAGIAASPIGAGYPTGGLYFPLIITTLLIEQAGRSLEEHGLGESLVLLASTMAVAAVVALLGLFLLRQPPAVVWGAFAASIVVSLAAGRYLGLRLSEFIRFKFLRRTHVHKR